MHGAVFKTLRIFRREDGRQKERERPSNTRFDHCCATEAWPPPKWRGKWFAECMRLEKFLNLNRNEGEVDKFLEFHGCREEYDDGTQHCSVAVAAICDDGTCYGSAFESWETCGISRSLEQNCEGLYRNVTRWIFSMKAEGLRPDFPGSGPELELWLAARGI